MERTRVKKLFSTVATDTKVLIKGWVRTRRDSKTFSFIEINDGSCLKNIQVIADTSMPGYEQISSLGTGTAVEISGTLVLSEGKGQSVEIKADTLKILGSAPETYPLQKKRHTDEFLRTIAHLRPRTNKYGAAFRIRSELSLAIHQFFRERDFFYIHTPIITSSDCEGAGELFRVTTINSGSQAESALSSNADTDFFGKPVNLTVSGQLSAEMFALSLGDVYTFGPTFRAENSNTRRHAAEFWMVEPEMAFCDLDGDMDIAESFVQYLVSHALNHCTEDIDLFARFVDKTLLKTLETITSRNFSRISYSEAVDILINSKHNFSYDVSFGKDLQSEHEQFLADEYFKGPVIVYNYPKEIKPFYMRVNDDDLTVAAMDILVPNIGEIIGGSQREERLTFLESRMQSASLPKEKYWWYLDSRLFGSVPHSGFGLGFERLLMLVTGIHNIRDVIPFPRTPKSIDF
jgi:asparaginyl-tRNA synthetase